jgi:hypothetical protein
VSAPPPPYVRRLMLALDAGQCAGADLMLAVELAALIGAELEGLFVEDSDLLSLAQLPFVREVGGRSGQDRPIVRESMESLLRRRVQRVASELERAGKERNVAVSHRTARGKVVRQALAQCESRDAVLLHAFGSVRLVPRRVCAAAGPVMVWYEDAATATASFDIAVNLARQLRSDLLIGFAASRFVTESEIRGQLRSSIALAPGRVGLRAVEGTDVDALIGAARAAKATQLVLAAGGRLATVEMLERMLSSLASGVILVR